MDALKKRRTILRANFTRIASTLQELIKSEGETSKIKAKLEVLLLRADELKELNGQIFDKMLEVGESQDVIEKEVGDCDEYTFKANELKHLCHGCDIARVAASIQEIDGGSVASSRSSLTTRKFKLPTLELKKFGGDVRDWLPFWSQFKKIDEDEDIACEDKFQYLLLATIPNSRARQVVESYPSTAGNYSKAIESLKSRFGRDDLLVEVYVRELLKLVLNNAFSCSSKFNLSTLYDKIETQLRALETLGVTTDRCAAMLYPLVESCLPEELLRVWQRSSDSSDEDGIKVKNRLTKLMTFLKVEVESEERISLAMNGFSDMSDNKLKKSKPKVPDQHTATAAGLMNCNDGKCVFCDGNHGTNNCYKASSMTFDQKRKILTDKQACFKCAKIGHRSRFCRERIKCVLCGKQHIILLCTNLGNKSNMKDTTTKEANSQLGAELKEKTLANFTDMDVFLQTVRVKIRNDTSEREIRAIFDSGSQRSYLLKTTAEEMNYSLKHTQQVVHTLFGGMQTSAEQHNCYDVRLSSLDNKYHCRFEVLDQTVICHTVASIYPGDWTKELQQVNIDITDTQGDGPIELLIGADVAGKLFTGKKRILGCGLVAMHTLLGWVLMGKTPKQYLQRCSSMIVTSLLSKEMLVSDWWKLESIGIKDPLDLKTKRENEIAVRNNFLKTINVDTTGRYVVQLPWRADHPTVPRSFEIAEARLQRTIVKLQKEHLFEDYDKVFDNWLEEGIIEAVPLDQISRTAHYLPHRPVVKASSLTTKIRPVFDASAHEKGKPSLNNCLETGENLIELIPTILLRFRLFQYGAVADITKAFLQIAVAEKDIDFLRFLWIDKEGKVTHYRHKRVVFGLCCSPFLLGAVIHHHLKTQASLHPVKAEIFKQLAESFYVDNCVTSLPSEEAAYTFQQESKQIMTEGKFDLRGWEISHIIDNESNQCSQLLGMLWNRKEDCLSISSSSLKRSIPDVLTKRIMLSVVQRIFDPLGIASPVTVCVKLLLQQMWEREMKWEDKVDDVSHKTFMNWYNELHLLGEIKIPRWIHGFPNEENQWSIHTFVDASQVAYAAVVFIRVVTEKNTYVHLLQAKVRVAPLKKLSIPRLELLAATIGARLYNSIKNLMKFEKMESYFWSDSATVISWIHRDEQWATFVWNRVEEIRSLTDKIHWKHVPGNLKPADLPSRGCSPRHLLESKWWEGPTWLYEDNSCWPSNSSIQLEFNESEIYSERKKTTVSSVALMKPEDLWFCRYFSDYYKMVRMIGWVSRFIHNSQKVQVRNIGNLTREEFDTAECTLLTLVQKQAFKNYDKQLANLNTVKDETGLVRLKSCIINREDTKEFRFPILLPSKHCVVERLIRKCHEENCHAGAQILMSILREKYWIIGGRKSVKNVIQGCVICRRQKSQPLQVISPSLHVDRIRDAKTFEIVGIDLAGPVYLRSKEKAWICLFTCAIYRAVHLELVTSLSTNCFLQAFRRFIARRGRPKTVYCDNGTNFVGSRNVLQQINWSDIEHFSTVKRIEWRFNPPSAPWWGGWWERLVGLMKQLLRRVLGRASLSYEELTTVLIDCESVINSRPLTSMTNDPNDLTVLTPNMFLHELEETGVPDLDDVDRRVLSKRFKYLQSLRDNLHKRFRSEYLGRVVELFPGQDGAVRLVRVKTARGILLRPVQRLHPLEGMEILEEGELDIKSSKDSVHKSPIEQPTQIRPPPVNDLSSDPHRIVSVTRGGRPIRRPRKYPS